MFSTKSKANNVSKTVESSSLIARKRQATLNSGIFKFVGL
jgi:hypothetical protein